MNLRVQQRNVIAATALSAGTKTSGFHRATVGKGVRFYVTCSAVTTSSSADSIALCAQAPGTTTAVVIATIAGAAAGHLLTTVGTFVFDFYPSSTSSSAPSGGTVTINGGAAAVSLPLNWAVQLVIGTGGAATIQVDAEVLP